MSALLQAGGGGHRTRADPGWPRTRSAPSPRRAGVGRTDSAKEVCARCGPWSATTRTASTGAGAQRLPAARTAAVPDWPARACFMADRCAGGRRRASARRASAHAHGDMFDGRDRRCRRSQTGPPRAAQQPAPTARRRAVGAREQLRPPGGPDRPPRSRAPVGPGVHPPPAVPVPAHRQTPTLGKVSARARYRLPPPTLGSAARRLPRRADCVA